MSIQLPQLLLASASSLLPESLGATTGEMPLGDMHTLSFLLMLAATPGIVMLVALGIRYLGRSRLDDEPGTAAEPLGKTEPDELARFMRDAIEQLNGIAVALRDTIPEAEQAPGQELSSTTGLRRPSARDDERRSGAAVTEERIAERVGTLDETAPRTDPLPLGSAIETMHSVIHDKALAQLAIKMRKLTELANRMQDERLAMERNAMDPQLASDSIAASRHYLSFTLGDERFAVSTLNIHGVVEATQLIAEPSMPPKIRKAIRLRGALVPVIDLGARFGGQPIELGWSSRIVVLEVANGDRLQLIGVVVDTVGKLLEIAPTEIEPPAPSATRIRNDFTLGTVRADNRTVTLLDIGWELLAHELAMHRNARPGAEQERPL